MEFQKIRFKETEGVELIVKLKLDNGAAEARTFTCSTPPLPELPAALQAFRPFLLSLLPLRDDEITSESGETTHLLDKLSIITLSIDEEPRTKKTGLIITALLPIEDANGRPLVLNTPRMREWEDDGSEQPKGTYGEDIAALIEAAQDAARRYYRGDRGQTEIFTAAETTAAAPEKTNGGDPAKAPKVRRQRRVKEIEGAGRVANPEATVPPTDEVIHKQLLISGVNVPIERIAKWLSSEREEALKYAQDPDGNAAPYCVRRDMEQELATSAGD